MQDLPGQIIQFVPNVKEATERYHPGSHMFWLMLFKFSLKAVTRLHLGAGGD